MSSITAILNNQKIYMGADTAVSTEINGTTYRIGDAHKMIFNNNFIIGCVGIFEKVNALFDLIQKDDDIDIDNIINYLKANKSNTDKIELSCMVALIQDDVPTLIILRQETDYQKEVHQSDDMYNFQVHTIGIKIDEMGNSLIKNLNNTLDKKQGKLTDTDMQNVFIDSYNANTYSGLGGELMLASLSPINGGYAYYPVPLNDNNVLYYNNASCVAKHGTFSGNINWNGAVAYGENQCAHIKADNQLYLDGEYGVSVRAGRGGVELGGNYVSIPNDLYLKTSKISRNTIHYTDSQGKPQTMKVLTWQD